MPKLYPDRPVRMLVTFSAGSQTDVLARLIGGKLAENSGQQVVVDNRPSAGRIPGMCWPEMRKQVRLAIQHFLEQRYL